MKTILVHFACFALGAALAWVFIDALSQPEPQCITDTECETQFGAD